jgi:hypothetical protein
MQRPYEIVQKAIRFDHPDRLPMEFEMFGICDTHEVRWNQIVPWDCSESCNYDEWGCLWQRTEQDNMGQVRGHPLSKWSQLDKYTFPDPDNADFYEGMEEKFEGGNGKYIKTGIFMLLFERLHSLRGFENTLTDFHLEQNKVEKLADRIVEFNLRVIESISSRFPGRMHGFTFSDDWGTERGTIISPRMWTDFFKPRYQRIFSACKTASWDIWMHSCGKINPLIPYLLEVGVDVLNLQQPRTNGIQEIGDAFSGKICFSTLCDIQQTLPGGNAEEIEKEAKALIDRWATDSGGLILSAGGNDVATGTSRDSMRAMFNAFVKHDRWAKNRNV